MSRPRIEFDNGDTWQMDTIREARECLARRGYYCEYTVQEPGFRGTYIEHWFSLLDRKPQPLNQSPVSIVVYGYAIHARLACLENFQRILERLLRL